MTKRKRKQLPQEPVEAHIHSLSHDGRGISKIDGKTVFISGALPGEDVMFTYTNKRGKFDEGEVSDIIISSKLRSKPDCEYFLKCGGCSLQHLNCSAQIEHKQNTLLEQLQHFGQLRPKVIISPLTAKTKGYRRKARLGVRYVTKKEKLLVGFRERNGRYLTNMDSCTVLDPKVGMNLEKIAALIRSLSIFEKIPQVEVACGEENTALVFRHIADLSATDQQCLINFGQQENFHIYLQPNNIASIHRIWPQQGPERLQYKLAKQKIELLFHPSDFIQVNAEINQHMIDKTIELLDIQTEDKILDLFCGLGNFSLALAKHCQHVVGIEGDAEMIKRAAENAKHNKIDNTEFYSFDLSKDFTRQNWSKYNYDKLVIDPPRSGALNVITQIPMFKPKRIVYVSCNPATLARDAGELDKLGYKLQQAGVMDMFPHTSHVESIALFTQ